MTNAAEPVDRAGPEPAGLDRSSVVWAEPSRLQRVDEHPLSDDRLGQLWRTGSNRLLRVDGDRRLPCSDDRLRFADPAAAGEYDHRRHFLLGTVDGTAYFATSEDFDGPGATLRDVAAALTGLDRDLATTAIALINWHRNESFCPRCGTASEIGKAGWSRHCPSCGNEYFPRTDPAVIVAIIDDHGEQERLLLGRQPGWGNRVSVFAGFVESGESAEQAVHREMAEEVGVRLRSVDYFGSQPWPYPRSLMLGFVARVAEPSSFAIDRTEIVYADWFTRDRLRTEAAEQTITLPTPSSIANRLVSGWLAGRL